MNAVFVARLGLLGFGGALLILVAFRIFLHRRATGSTGVAGLRRTMGVGELLADPGFVGGFVMIFAGFVYGSLGYGDFDVIPMWAVIIAVFLGMVGAVGAWWSQTVMGESWGFGVEEGQDIELVTKGPFALVRNPIYTFMIFGTIGCLLMAPNAFTVMGWAVLLAAVQLLVRGVEEPHLIDSSANYRAYAATTGRFLPGIGKIS